MIDENGLPCGWVETSLGAIVQPSRPRHSPQENPELPFIGMEHVEPHSMKLLDTVPAGQMKSSAVHFWPGDVLYGRLRPYLNKVYSPDFEGLCSAEFIVFPKSDVVERKFLQYFLNSAQFVSFASHLNEGDRPRVDFTQLSFYPVHLPPFKEQQRIVEEIEKQFSRLDAGVAALKQTQAKLKRYRAAVLQAACEGRLVPTEAELARAEGQDYDKPTISHENNQTTIKKRHGRLWGAGVVPDLTEDERNRLPVGWVWAKVLDLGADPEETVQVGPMSMRSKDFVETGVPVLNVGCVRWDAFDESKLDFMPEVIAKQYSRYQVHEGDILFTRSGTVGRCAVAQPHQNGWLMTFHLLRVRTDNRYCLPDYLRTVFEGAKHIRRQTREASIGTTRAGFNTTLLQTLDVPLPTLNEQRRILEEVERRLSIIEGMEAAVAANLKRAERLRQSILKRAFEGRLVPQDPNDEPASDLLERIREERETSSNRTKKATRRKKENPQLEISL